MYLFKDASGQFSSDSCVQLFVTPWTAAHQPSCPSPTPGVYSNSCPLSRWCHPTISCSVVPFSSCLQPFPASGSFPISQFFASGGQSIGVSHSSVLAWRILWTVEPGGLPSLGSHRVGHDWSDLAAAAASFPQGHKHCMRSSFSSELLQHISLYPLFWPEIRNRGHYILNLFI